MTRFDEALQEFSQASEQQMATRVGSAGNRQVVVHEVGRGRSRRAAVQSVAAVAAVAVVGAGTWLAVGQFRDPQPAHTPNPIPALSNPAFECGEPFPFEPGTYVAATDVEIPEVQQQVMLPTETSAELLDLTPGATTLGSEGGLVAGGAVITMENLPAVFGFNHFAALVDADGKVAAVTTLQEGANSNYVVGEFLPGSCMSDPTAVVAEPLDGVFRVHVVTQYWVDAPGAVVATWVDSGLVEGASLTLDYTMYADQTTEAEELAAEQSQLAADAINTSGDTLATVDGPAVIERTGACAVAEGLGDYGLGGVPALTAPLAPVEITFDGARAAWAYPVESTPWWAAEGTFTVFFIDGDGALAAVAASTGVSESLDGDTVSRSTELGDDGGCDGMGLPTAPGIYEAYVYAHYPEGLTALSPVPLREAGGYARVAAWAPAGTYQVP